MGIIKMSLPEPLSESEIIRGMALEVLAAGYTELSQGELEHIKKTKMSIEGMASEVFDPLYNQAGDQIMPILRQRLEKNIRPDPHTIALSFTNKKDKERSYNAKEIMGALEVIGKEGTDTAQLATGILNETQQEIAEIELQRRQKTWQSIVAPVRERLDQAAENTPYFAVDNVANALRDAVDKLRAIDPRPKRQR